MAGRCDSADTLFLWYLQGHGSEAETALATHADEPLERVVADLAKAHPGWTADRPPETADGTGGTSDVLFGHAVPDPGDLAEALDRMRPWLPAARTEAIAGRLADVRSHPDPRAAEAMRRSLGALSLEADFRRALAGPGGVAVPRAVLLFHRDGRALAVYGGAPSADLGELSRIVRRGISSRKKGAYAASLRGGRVLVVSGDRIVAAVVFPSAPGRDAVTTLINAVGEFETSSPVGDMFPTTAKPFAAAIVRLLSPSSL